MKKVIIFFIDGGTWELLNPWIDQGFLPNIKKIKDSGISGIMESTIPPSTAPAIQSFSTGRNPGNLGIFGVFKEDGSVISFNDVKEKTIWEVLGERGYNSLIVELPTTYPIRPFNGSIITGFLTPSKSSEFFYPPELKEELVNYPSGVEYDHSSSLKITDLKKTFDSIVDISKKRFEIFIKLFKKQNPDFSIFYIKSTDILGHLFWEQREYLLEFYKILDEELEEIIELSENDANIFILSDHGFEDASKYTIHINSWLAKEGYFPSSPSVKYGIYSWLDKNKNIKKIAKFLLNFFGKDMGRSKKNLRASMSKEADAYWDVIFPIGIRLAEKALDKNPALADEILAKLRKLEFEGGKVFKIADKRENIYSGPYVYKVPNIILLPSKDFMIYGDIDENIFSPIKNMARKGDHGSAYEAIFMASGPDISETGASDKIKITDIFPTILDIFGIKDVESDGKPIIK